MSEKKRLQRATNQHAAKLRKELFDEAKRDRRTPFSVGCVLLYNQTNDIAYASGLDAKQLALVMRAFADQLDPPKGGKPTQPSVASEVPAIPTQTEESA